MRDPGNSYDPADAYASVSVLAARCQHRVRSGRPLSVQHQCRRRATDGVFCTQHRKQADARVAAARVVIARKLASEAIHPGPPEKE